ncbi:hypothetical protein GCK32_022814 [Trichostrongylus colubriformis]|uniref:Uncharacterized protein n=1 Tax=Trichostrongylus colubriformis TaxID=6319 RepID=A0AAN8ILY8_TRICO
MPFPDIRTKEDLDHKKEDIFKLSSEERFLFVLTLFSRTLPSQIDSNESDGSSAHARDILKVVNNAPSSSVDKVATRSVPASDKVSKVFTQSSLVQEEKTRSIVVAGLPEADSRLGLKEMSSFEWSNIWELLGELGVTCQPAFAYRLGKVRKGLPRLLKIVLPATFFQKTALRNAPLLRKSTKFSKVFIRPSLDAEERKIAFALREQRRHLIKTTGGSYRIYKDCIYDNMNGKKIPLDPKFVPLSDHHKVVNSGVNHTERRRSLIVNAPVQPASGYSDDSVVILSSSSELSCKSLPPPSISTDSTQSLN